MYKNVNSASVKPKVKIVFAPQARIHTSVCLMFKRARRTSIILQSQETKQIRVSYLKAHLVQKYTKQTFHSVILGNFRWILMHVHSFNVSIIVPQQGRIHMHLQILANAAGAPLPQRGAFSGIPRYI